MGGGADLAHIAQPRKKGLDFLAAHIPGMANAMPTDKEADPVGVVLLGPEAVLNDNFHVKVGVLRLTFYDLQLVIRQVRQVWASAIKEGSEDMTIKRMDNVLIVVDDLEAVKAFFIELGLKLEGETTVEGPLIGSLIGLKDVRATLAMMRTPDGQGIELDKFHTPNAIRFGPVDAPVNTLGLRRVMFAVDDIDAVVARMREHGAELIGEMQYEDTYRLAYIRGPEGIIVALAEQLG
jgi:catechol 2,3-dioxygenase-like lactoylglutathione lyase family enzyme